MAKYYQPEIETMPYEDLRKLQNERFLKQVRHVWDNVPYYRQKMEAKGVTIDDIQSLDDLHKLPFLKKDDLRDAYPYGLMGKPKSNVSGSIPLPAPPASVWWHSTPSMMLTSGRTAVPAPSWRPAAVKKMCFMWLMATACSQAEWACTAAAIRLAV